MTTSPVRVERRVGQRFPYLLPISIRQCGTAIEGVGFTQDLSSRGVFLFTDVPLTEGSEVELTLRMPSEITLGESMPVRCRGHVLRVSRPVVREHGTPAATPAETKIGVAVRLECYEYLQESAEPARVAALHSHHEDERPLAHSAARPSLI